MTEFVVYSDESESKGSAFSNFYGGALVRSCHIDDVRRVIAEKKLELRFRGEVKWQKVTENYLDKYISLMELFFDLISEDKIKVRIMFTQNIRVARHLTKEHRDQEYFILYYEFIKHAFGLIYCDEGPARIRLLLDQMPANREQREKFRGFIVGLTQNTHFRKAGIVIHRDDIADVSSHEHDVLQCLDVILGAISFRLNNLHLMIPEGKRRRGRRTRAKEKLYKIMYRRMSEMRPNFNIGISTGHDGQVSNRWMHSYRHWLFQPYESEIR